MGARRGYDQCSHGKERDNGEGEEGGEGERQVEGEGGEGKKNRLL